MSFDQLLKQRIREHAESTDQGAIEGARKQNAIRKEKNSKRQRKFYLAHQDELREKSKKRSQRYRDENPEKVKESRKRWNESNREHVNALNRASYERNHYVRTLAQVVARHKKRDFPFKGKWAKFGSLEALEAELARARKEAECKKMKHPEDCTGYRHETTESKI